MRRYGEHIGANRDPFAYFLLNGGKGDVDPSPEFDAAAYRKRYMGRLSRNFSQRLTLEERNPLIHWLLSRRHY